ncbi:arginine-tRNA-protein transferase [Endogone sp. FLAS-F59071]|nr:arginine-tRNA-protein transferase [Endogone sp. FLAS-F59071]|eukprot:RUS16583.1 arginine-tRNA-protein transferase [Endogone sp. FLAS-F59071]
MSLAESPISLVVNCGFNVSDCGYCKQEDTSHTFGIWAHFLTCRPRKSNPTLDMKTPDSHRARSSLRLDVTQFRTSKSQRKIVSKFNRYIEGTFQPTKNDGELMNDHDDTPEHVASTHLPAKGDQKPARKLGTSGDGTHDLVEMIHAAEEEYLPENEKWKHRLQIVLEPASFTKEKYELYCKYQIEIHHDTLTKLKEKSFRNFLVDSPLRVSDFPLLHFTFPPSTSSNPAKPTTFQPEAPSTPGTPGYGSFHQNYILDGQLIAVAVLDVLPKCVSSVYFLYDPDYAFLGLGNYSALREIALAQELGTKGYDELTWYCMGFYIHNCQKMKYKGQYKPSDLLDPETYAWYPIEQCMPLLDNSKYVAFSRAITGNQKMYKNKPNANTVAGNAPPPGMLDPEQVTKEMLKESTLPYRNSSSVRAETREYYAALGADLAKRMLLYINESDN